ncbi:MAG: hypothetical protein HYV27_07735 [Candidatus Hydrogenedentes bacterium]|nr:hypothetical protein [Candidatus Hydrogenedentota bacterium]
MCLSTTVLASDPDLLEVVQRAGVSHVWMAHYFYGYRPYALEDLQAWRRKIEALGMYAGAIHLPLGHPGDSLGAMDGNIPLTPPTHWKQGVSIDGAVHAGTSLHAPATEENAVAVKEIGAAGFHTVFLDDDYRLARGPGVIGGCFCAEHRERFLEAGGLGAGDWDTLLSDVRSRRLSSVLRAWVEFTCGELTACFRAQQEAAPNLDLGIMVMYLGAEKAGIQLTDYRDVPFRVGELMFNDASFDKVKGKTDELFSALFHRRFARPELAYSETTAFPSDRLSAANMAAKLAVSTIADVRNTMFMSGLTPFPKSHWDVLGPAMARQSEIHGALAGRVPRGPLKHYWGEAARYVGDDNPYSLFLAMGVPFEVVDAIPSVGWTFLCDADVPQARGLGSTLIARPEARTGWARGVAETLEGLYALKREIVPTLEGVPYVAEDRPVVCAWYPESRRVLLWNLGPQQEAFTVRQDGRDLAVTVFVP